VTAPRAVAPNPMTAENDVAVGDELVSSPDPTDEVGQLFVSGAKVGAVAMLKENSRPNAGIDPVEMRRVYR
jgi:hypothetical protein